MRKIIHPPIPENTVAAHADISPFLLQLLYNRNIVEAEEIKDFLYAISLDDPYLIPDMQKCVDRIAQAKDKGEKVVIHGDYDVDGVCSSAIMFLYLKYALKMKNLGVYIPSRHTEGYGLSKQTIDKFVEEGVNLLITVDCGIKDADLVEYAKEAGIDVIISDHHTPEEKLPQAVAVIHPMFYTHKNLCGAGVAFKITQALDKKFNLSESDNYIDLAALGTVCDIMELRGENRAIVKKGIEKLRQNKRLGLEELMSLSKVEKPQIDTYHIGYIIGPKLNASGRLLSAYESLKLLVTQDRQTAQTSAQTLFDLNKQRQEETTRALHLSLEYVQPDQYIHVIYIPDISVGVIGLIAGKLKEITGKPCIVFTDDKEEGVLAGSARSIDAFDIIAALDRYKETFVSHGGHKKAAGVKIQKDQFEPFQASIQKYAEKALSGQELEKTVYVDMEIDLSQNNLAQMYAQIKLLEPFGEANPRPVFASSVKVVSVAHIGENGKHLKLQVKDAMNAMAKPIEVIGFHMGDVAVSNGEIVDIVYNVGKNSWNGQVKFQLQLIDLISSK